MYLTFLLPHGSAVWIQLLLPTVFATSCRVIQCDLKLTPEHGAQIALVQLLGVSESRCLDHMVSTNIPDYSGFYCPDEKFCGLDLHPESTKELSFLANKSCSLLTKDEEKCHDLIKALDESGYKN